MKPSRSQTMAPKNFQAAGRSFMRIAIAAAVACLSIVGFSHADDAKAAIRQPTNIPAQGLGAALRALAKERNFQIVYATQEIAKLRTRGIVGELTTTEALEQLLSGTGLTYRYLDGNTVTIVAPATDASREVTGAVEGERPPTSVREWQEPERQARNTITQESDGGEAPKRTFWQRLRLAQAEVAQGTDASSAASDPKVSEVIVTATKRSERVQDVPISIAVVGAEDIDRRGLVGSADYLRGMPGVNQTEIGYGGQAIIIRGLETTNSFLNFSGGTTVGTYFGETPTTNSAGLLGSSVDLKLVDIDRVEVLRGPQGTAFGSSSMGGTVRTIPAAPRTDRFEGQLTGGYSASSGDGGDNYTMQGTVNIPLVADRLAIRAVAYDFSDSGFYRNKAGSDPAFQSGFVAQYGIQAFATDEEDVGTSNTVGGRISALFKVTDDLRFTLGYVRQKTEVDGYPISTSGTYEQSLSQVAPEHVFRGEKGGINDNEVELVNGVLEYDFSWASLLGSYSYLEGESEHTLVAPLFAGLNLPVSFRQFSPHRERSGEIRLVTRLEGAWNFVVGAYADQHDDQYLVDWVWFGDPATNTFVPPQRDLIDYVDLRDLKQKAAFAEASWQFMPRFTLTAGVRGYDYERRTRINQTGPLLAGQIVATDDKTEDSGTTFRANLSYKPTDESLVYAAWGEGFRLGRPQPPVPVAACDMNGDGLIDGTNAPIGSTGSVGSDDVTSYELGAKLALLDRRLTMDAAVFRMNWNNIPVQLQPDCGYAYTTNAGSARSQGVELQANLQVSDAFLVSVGGSYNDAELTTDVPAQGFSSGDSLPGTPKESANLGLQYSFDVAGRAAYVRADSIYVGRFFGDIPQSPTQKAGDYVKVNASARLEFGSLDVDLYVHNLTDEDAFVARGNGLDAFYGYRLRPRTIGFQLGYDF
jgi:iron complex outermembrane recepter protein